MAQSRAKKNSIGSCSKKGMKDGGYFIKNAINPENKGKLRQALGAKEGHNIPEKKLEKATHSKNPTLKKEAVFAETLKMFRNK